MRSRNWLITINYKSIPAPNSHDEIAKKINDDFNKITYLFLQLEKGKSEVYHHHIILCLENPITFESIKKKFPRGHIELLKRNLKVAVDYLKKSKPIFHPFEQGKLPNQGERTDWHEIINLLKDGNTPYQIRDLFPSNYGRYRNAIHQIYQEILDEEWDGKRIHKEVVYIYGQPGTGKTRSILDKYGDKNVYRITDYSHPFDLYRGQDIIVFEEFRSSLKIEQMLNYLDIYSIRLPARYNNRVATYTKVYIVTNISLVEQYFNTIKNHPDTYRAFLRRINRAEYYIWKHKSKEVHIETFNDLGLNLYYHMNLHNKKWKNDDEKIVTLEWLDPKLFDKDYLKLAYNLNLIQFGQFTIENFLED